MLLASALLINNIILFVLETVGYHTCHSGRHIFVIEHQYLPACSNSDITSRWLLPSMSSYSVYGTNSFPARELNTYIIVMNDV